MARETVRMEGLAGALKTLKSLPPELVSKRGGPVRVALRKGAKLLQERSQLNLDAITVAHGDQSTGLLRDNVHIVRDSNMRGGERYTVRVRRKTYPDQPGVTTAKVGALLESGTEHRAPMPWMSTAYRTLRHQVLNTFTVELNRGLARIIRKLERQNRVRR